MIQQGDNLGGFELVRPLGEGPFGEVWLGHDVNGTRAAVKLIKGAFVKRHAGQAAFNRLLSSIRAHQQVRHEGLVAVYGPIEDAEKGALGMATEYAEGRSMSQVRLPERARQGQDPRSLAALLRWFEGLTETLSWLHEQSMVHGNLKPTNLIVVREKSGHRLEVLDLPWSAIGLAAPAPGAPTYLAPEQVQGGAPTAASDQWSVGTLMFRILTADDPRSGLAGFPTQLVVALQRATRTTPRERYGNVRQFGAALAEARIELEAQVSSSAPPGTPLPMVGTPAPSLHPTGSGEQMASTQPPPTMGGQDGLPPPTFAPQASMPPGMPQYAPGYPGQPYPGYPPGYPGQPYPGQAYPGYPMPGYPYPQPYPQPYPGYPMPGYPPPGYAGGPVPGQPGPMQNPAMVSNQGHPPGAVPPAPKTPPHNAPPGRPAAEARPRGATQPPVPTARRMVKDADTDAGESSQEQPRLRRPAVADAMGGADPDAPSAALDGGPDSSVPPPDPALIGPAATLSDGPTEYAMPVATAASQAPAPPPGPAMRPRRRWGVAIIGAVLMFLLGGGAITGLKLAGVPIPGLSGAEEALAAPLRTVPTVRADEPEAPPTDDAVAKVAEPTPPTVAADTVEAAAAAPADDVEADGEAAAAPADDVEAPGEAEAPPEGATAPKRRRRPKRPKRPAAPVRPPPAAPSEDERAREEQVACDEGDADACLSVARRAGAQGEDAPARAAYARACNFGKPSGCYQAGRLAVADDAAGALALYEKACGGGYARGCEQAAALLRKPGTRDADRARTLADKACALGRKSACREAPEEAPDAPLAAPPSGATTSTMAL